MNQMVVVVNDDLDTLEFLDLVLSSRGIAVVVYSVHTDAAALILRILPSLVLLDLQTPADRRAGLRVLDQLRADDATVAIPVVLMSSDHRALGRHASRRRRFH